MSSLFPPASWSELSRLRETVVAHMPITEYMQFSLFQDAAERLVATAPLEPNSNHLQTAFGGSLSMLATVVGWAMTTLLLREHGRDAEVVIQQSHIDFCTPVCGDLLLRCARPTPEEQKSFFDTLERWGKARLPLCCTAEQGDEERFNFEAAYVALAG